ncbi:MAG TPA: acyltransferase family protein [Streptosporangiaceae bacterium]|nr:acyltransferase family protein [Streptosporangiaceae bacterium]
MLVQPASADRRSSAGTANQDDIPTEVIAAITTSEPPKSFEPPESLEPLKSPESPGRPAEGGPAKKAFRAPGLDGVRALAVLAVLGFHESWSWLHGGFLGVDIFFVLSGFLITDLLAAKFARDGNVGLSNFWQRRARRLLPALGVVLLTVTAAVTLLEPSQRGTLRPALLGAVTYTSNWWQAFAHQSYFSLYGPPPVFQHLWSLAVEEQFYLIWPLIIAVVLLLVRHRIVRALIAWAAALGSALAMWAIYQPGADPSLVYYATFTHASGLLIGAALALTWPLAKVAATAGKSRAAFDVAGAIGLAVLAWSMWHFSGGDPFMYPYGLVIAGVAAGCLVLAATSPGRLAAVFSRAPLRWLGVRSYGIYLWHWPVIAITVGMNPRWASAFGARAIDAVLPIGLAAASWRWLEEPILRNGLRSELRRRTRLLREVARTVLKAPAAAAMPIFSAVALLAVAGTAGYGLLHPKTGPTLQDQIASASTITSATQLPDPSATQTTGQPNPSWIKADGSGPYRPGTRAHQARFGHFFGSKVIAIGDSVMLASASELAGAMPGIYIDAQVSRAMIAGVVLVQDLAASKRLRQVLVVGLGTNGPITLDQISQLRAAIGPSRWLLLVNTFVPRSWESEVNTTIKAAARRYPNVLMINWHNAIEHHTNLLWSDGIHPMPIGGKYYAKVVKAVVLRALRHRPPRPYRARQVPGQSSGFQLHAG